MRSGSFAGMPGRALVVARVLALITLIVVVAFPIVATMQIVLLGASIARYVLAYGFLISTIGPIFIIAFSSDDATVVTSGTTTVVIYPRQGGFLSRIGLAIIFFVIGIIGTILYSSFIVLSVAIPFMAVCNAFVPFVKRSMVLDAPVPTIEEVVARAYLGGNGDGA